MRRRLDGTPYEVQTAKLAVRAQKAERLSGMFFRVAQFAQLCRETIVVQLSFADSNGVLPRQPKQPFADDD
jgi:hypothetical protein